MSRRRSRRIETVQYPHKQVRINAITKTDLATVIRIDFERRSRREDAAPIDDARFGLPTRHAAGHAHVRGCDKIEGMEALRLETGLPEA